jgi:gliding motility-associated lipoprotein GldH
MRGFRYSLIIFALLSIFTGCLPGPYFQKEESIPQNAWTYNFKPSFTFDITDTAAAYQPYFVIRHTQAYPYCNVWVWLYVTTPGDSIPKKERINVVLAESSGKWLGRGMGEIYEQRMRIKFSDSVKFNHKGTYQVTMEQNMRINPLPDVLHIGFRQEKTGIKAQ